MISKLINKIKKLRKSYYQKTVIKTAAKIRGSVKVNGPSYVNRKTVLGNNVHFNGMRIIGHGKVIIGDNFHSGQDCVIISESHNFEGKLLPYDETFISKETIIEDNVWLGHGVLILPGAHIGEGAIIQAGAVVTGKIEKCGIAGGNPAKVFKYRNQEHYEQLKEEKKFN